MGQNIHIKHFLTAFGKVSKRYYSSHALKYSGLNKNIRLDDTEIVTYEQQTERTYAYELYHQLRCVMNENPQDYRDISWNGEITKIDFNKTTLNSKSIIPDLILHKSQIDVSPEYQILFVEIKTNPNPVIEDDIKKILLAIKVLDFKFGIFVTLNSNFDDIIKKMKVLLENETDDVLKKIYVLHDKFLNGTEQKTTYEFRSVYRIIKNIKD